MRQPTLSCISWLRTALRLEVALMSGWRPRPILFRAPTLNCFSRLFWRGQLLKPIWRRLLNLWFRIRMWKKWVNTSTWTKFPQHSQLRNLKERKVLILRSRRLKSEQYETKRIYCKQLNKNNVSKWCNSPLAKCIDRTSTRRGVLFRWAWWVRRWNWLRNLEVVWVELGSDLASSEGRSYG